MIFRQTFDDRPVPVVRALLQLAAALLLVSIAVASPADAQEHPLSVARSVPAAWGGSNSTAVLGAVRCDAKGDLYFRLVPPFADTATANLAAISEVTSDGRAGPQFSASAVPGFEASRDFFGGFSVDAAGNVLFLFRQCPESAGSSCHEAVARFGPDGKFESSTILGTGDFDPQHLVALASGNLFVSGIKTTADRARVPEAAVYSVRGQLLTEVNLPDSSSLPQPSGLVPEGARTIIATDGNHTAYLTRNMRHAELYTINEQGQVLAHPPLTQPFADALPEDIRFDGGGRVLVQFAKYGPQGATYPGYFFSLVEAATGKTISTFTGDVSAGGLVGCLLPGTGLEFLATDQRGAAEIRFDPLQ